MSEDDSQSNPNFPQNFSQIQRNRFTIPPISALNSHTINAPRGPLLFRSSFNQQQPPPPSINHGSFIFPAASRAVPSNVGFLQFPPSSSSRASTSSEGSSSDKSDNNTNSSRGRGKSWTDQETRFLLQIWQDNYPISKRRNVTTWDAIAKELNQQLKDQGQTKSYRSGQQCKNRIKALEDEYKRVKDSNNRSGNGSETCDYYDELDSVLGCKPSVTPKSIVECGIADDSDEDGSQKDNDDDDEDDELIAKTRRKRQTPTGKGKQPATTTPRRKVRRQEAETDDLIEFLTTSQEKDHAFFAKLAEKEADRELKSQKLMFDAIKDIAKIFKDNN